MRTKSRIGLLTCLLLWIFTASVMACCNPPCTGCKTCEAGVCATDDDKCHTCKECISISSTHGECQYRNGNNCMTASDCGTGRKCESCECVCDISQCGNDGECVSGTYDFSEYLSGAQAALNTAINNIPCVSGELTLGGSLSGSLCPCCPCGDCACTNLGRASANGTATCTGDLTGTLPGLTWGFNFSYKGNSVYGEFVFGPTIGINDIDASASITVFKRLNVECSDTDTCITFEGDVSVTAEAALQVDIELGVDLGGWWDFDLYIEAKASVTAPASACVKYETEGCPTCGEENGCIKSDAVLQDVVGGVEVWVDLCWPIPSIHWTSPPFTFYDGSDEAADCS